MIYGIGVDIIEIGRVRDSINNTASFLNKIFTEAEVQYFRKRNNRYESLAGAFAAKEAVSKALGTGIRGFSTRDIEVLRDELGKPFIEPHGKVKEIVERENMRIHLSISHNKENAIAYVIIEKEK